MATNADAEKLISVPMSTYSVFFWVFVSLSLNLKMDFAAIKKPTAVYWSISMNVSIKKRSNNPIHNPALAKPSVFTSDSIRHFSVAIPINIPKGILAIIYPIKTARIELL